MFCLGCPGAQGNPGPCGDDGFNGPKGEKGNLGTLGLEGPAGGNYIKARLAYLVSAQCRVEDSLPRTNVLLKGLEYV